MTRALLVASALALASCSQTFSFTSDSGLPDGGAEDAGLPDGGCTLPGQCQCVVDGQCPAGQPHCADDGRCVECETNPDCGPNGQCDLLTRRCATLCSDSAECDGGSMRCGDELPRRCVLCEDDLECLLYGGGRCAQAPGQCVQCVGDSDCSGARPHCDRTVGQCVGCVSNSQCSDTEYCALVTHSCVARP